MIRKLTLAILALALILPAEVYAWVNYVTPMFWAPGVAYTQLGWGYVFIGLLFVFIPIAVVGAIFEED